MHCYLFVVCKTPGCGMHHVLKHAEWPTADFGFLDVPDREFPLRLSCRCGQEHSYAAAEVRTETSQTALHPADFQDTLPDEEPSDTN